jgi:hypothetical protein
MGSPYVHEVRQAFCERLFQNGQFELFLLQVERIQGQVVR